jgi:hypothetical protein
MKKIFSACLILVALSQFCFATPDSLKWTNISGDLPNLHINSLAPHPFFTDSLFIGTNSGAFQTPNGGNHWSQLNFGENPDVRVTQIKTEMHPYLDWTVPVLWLGTEEYTMIPEDRLGRIFFSEDGGANWINTYFPRIAVSALEVPKDSSLIAFAAAYNPFYIQDGFYAMDDTGWVEYDLTPDDSIAIRINCIEVDVANPNRMFLATSNGVYSTTDWGINWTNSGSHHNSPWVVIPPQYPEMVFAILLGGTRSEGIYRSKDYGQYWERVCWTVNAVTFIPDYATPGVWYEAIKNLGVFKSIDDCSTWTDISNGLQEKDILCLVQDRINPMVLYAGTTNGIFRYEGSATSVNFSDKNAIQNKPKKFELLTAYPNPFNSNVQICYQVNMNMAHVKLEIYNIFGQRLKVLVDNVQSNGDHLIQWDGRDEFGQMSASGIYFCKLHLNRETVHTLKLLLIQ